MNGCPTKPEEAEGAVCWRCCIGAPYCCIDANDDGPPESARRAAASGWVPACKLGEEWRPGMAAALSSALMSSCFMRSAAFSVSPVALRVCTKRPARAGEAVRGALGAVRGVQQRERARRGLDGRRGRGREARRAA